MLHPVFVYQICYIVFLEYLIDSPNLIYEILLYFKKNIYMDEDLLYYKMRKLNIKIVVLLLVFILSSTVLVGAINRKESNNSQIDSVIVTLSSKDYRIELLENKYSKIIMDDFGYDITPGKPQLPAKTFLVGLPPGAKVSHIKVIKDNKTPVPGEYKIVTVPDIFSMDGKTSVKRNSFTSLKNKIDVKSSSSNDVYKYLGMGKIRTYSYAKIRFYPFTYENNKLVFHKSITLKIFYTKENEKPPYDNLMNDEISEIICNYDEIKDFYPTKPKNMAALSPQYDYVIITTDNLVDTLNDFKRHKENLGHSVKIVTTSWIYENYKDSGEDKAKAIRDFLVDKYLVSNGWGIKYVLIVGSPKTIPMRYCYPIPDNIKLRTPTDMYYADLTGGWDIDGDGLYGECWDDEPHFTAEVYVGRIPFDDAQTVRNICSKIKGFENDEGDWKKKALLLGAIMLYKNEGNESYPKTDGAALMEKCKDIFKNAGYSIKTMYEKEGLSPSQYSCNKPLTKSNVIKEWKKGYGIVNWQAHGKNTSALRKIWSSDNGNNIPEGSEIEYKRFIGSEDTSSLNNGMPSIVYACSCNNANPDDNSNLGFKLLKKGAVTFIGATGIFFGVVGW
jgi:hypothetical protein